jgi:hypothetical protein
MMSMEYTVGVSLSYEGRAMREQVVSAPGGGTHGYSGSRSGYSIPRSTAKCDGCAIISIDGATHGDGDSKPNSGTYRSATELIDRN